MHYRFLLTKREMKLQRQYAIALCALALDPMLNCVTPTFRGSKDITY